MFSPGIFSIWCRNRVFIPLGSFTRKFVLVRGFWRYHIHTILIAGLCLPGVRVCWSGSNWSRYLRLKGRYLPAFSLCNGSFPISSSGSWFYEWLSPIRSRVQETGFGSRSWIYGLILLILLPIGWWPSSRVGAWQNGFNFSESIDWCCGFGLDDEVMTSF